MKPAIQAVLSIIALSIAYSAYYALVFYLKNH